MKPAYDISTTILQLVASISELIGVVRTNYIDDPSPQLRKQNQIKTIQASLQIEGNTLTEEQITALIDNNRIVGPEKDIKEVLNAIEVYNRINSYNFESQQSFLLAHKQLMSGLIEKEGTYRTRGVGIVKGSKVEHVAPLAKNIKGLMNDLFKYLKNDRELTLIKSCVFHYEVEFIHPFLDGNGRMGRLWQALILIDQYPIFQFIPFETLIRNTQASYYKALSDSDKMGKSTPFLEYMLAVIERSLKELVEFRSKRFNTSKRIQYFLKSHKSSFTRKDYMQVFKDISTATASRDLKKGVDLGLLEKMGEANKTIYRKR